MPTPLYLVNIDHDLLVNVVELILRNHWNILYDDIVRPEVSILRIFHVLQSFFSSLTIWG